MARRLKILLPKIAVLGTLVFGAAVGFARDEKLAVLRIGSEVYTNVTVTSVTATDIYFNHANGFGNAKLKNLDPDLQTHFHYDPVKAGEVEQGRIDAAVRYRAQVVAAKEKADAEAKAQQPPADDGEPDPVSPQVYARSVLGQRPPQIVVDEWLTPPPNIQGKWVLVNFWSTSCQPCKDTISYLNELYPKFKDRVAFIGLCSDNADDVRRMPQPRMTYSVGVDTQARTQTALEVKALPHTLLIDPSGTVRFEGVLAYLDEKGFKRLLARYGHN